MLALRRLASWEFMSVDKIAGLLNAIEVFLTVVVTTFVSQVTIGGQQLDLATATGKSAALSAFLTAIYLGVRRAISAGKVSTT